MLLTLTGDLKTKFPQKHCWDRARRWQKISRSHFLRSPRAYAYSKSEKIFAKIHHEIYQFPRKENYFSSQAQASSDQLSHWAHFHLQKYVNLQVMSKQKFLLEIGCQLFKETSDSDPSGGRFSSMLSVPTEDVDEL